MDEELLFDIPFEVDGLEEIEEITTTYRLDIEHRRIGGKVEGIEAVAQAAWKQLQTRRFAHLIYDDQYGNDLFNKIHNSSLSPDYLDLEVPRMLEEALLADPRILEMTNYRWEPVDDDAVLVTIEIRTEYGQVDLEGVIEDVD